MHKEINVNKIHSLILDLSNSNEMQGTNLSSKKDDLHERAIDSRTLVSIATAGDSHPVGKNKI